MFKGTLSAIERFFLSVRPKDTSVEEANSFRSLIVDLYSQEIQLNICIEWCGISFEWCIMESVEGEKKEDIFDKDSEDAKIRYRKLLSTAKESFENGESVGSFRFCGI
jgi:hypothetical protein